MFVLNYFRIERQLVSSKKSFKDELNKTSTDLFVHRSIYVPRAKCTHLKYIAVAPGSELCNLDSINCIFESEMNFLVGGEFDWYSFLFETKRKLPMLIANEWIQWNALEASTAPTSFQKY